VNRGRGTASIVASPVLVGAVTTLVVMVAVFLAYNANKGLPFVPTYDLSAQLPTGADLVPGNEVRIGGFRVGLISNIRPGRGVVDGHLQNIAIVDLKLDKTIQPLSRDTTAIVRSRSVLGLKYLQLTPGRSAKTFKPGDTLPLAGATAPVEFDDFLNTFDEPTRENSQAALVGFGDALAARGPSLNEAIEAFNPFFTFLQPVATNLADPRTTIDQFFKQIGQTSAQVAPVARVNAQLFTLMANTFAAISQCASCLQATIEKGPPTEDTAIASFEVQRPFLVDFTDLSRRLTPAAIALRTSLPTLNDALRIGTPVSRSAVTLNNNTKKLFQALDFLARDPNTLLGLQNLRDTLSVTKPLINYVAPFQTVCNYADYFFTGLFGVLSEPTDAGTAQYVLVKSDSPGGQVNGLGAFANRPADVPKDKDPYNTSTGAQQLEALHATPFSPAIDARGRANCQVGQTGYLKGPLHPVGAHGRYPPANSVSGDNPTYDKFENNVAGGSHTVDSDYNALAGPTFTGLPSVSKVP
jgi:virulence factor Mce-like protein